MKNTRRIGAIAMLASGLLLLGYLTWQRRGEDRPVPGSVVKGERSVVLITVDTTRADRLEPYGSETVETPNLQRLGDRGIVFEQAYSVAPITLVAHTSILSGLDPFEHGVRNNGTQYVEPEVVTLAERLEERGFETGAFVSASVLERRYGLDQGFDTYDDDLSTGRDRAPRMVADRPAEATVASASAWLDGLDSDAPYFLWVHLYDPHASYSPPPPYRDAYRDRLYDGEIAYMDEQIGHLLAHPRLLGGDPEAAPIVSVLGDHGESLGEHGEKTHAILAYDSTLHVPWLLYLPGGPSGVRVSQPVGQVDLVPTILSSLDYEIGEGLSGRDLLPLVSGRVSPPASQPAYYSETYLPYYTYSWAKLKVLRQGTWKLIQGAKTELFDLHRDPRELTNIYDQQPGRAHDLERLLGEKLAQVEDSEAEAELALDTESLEKLRSLGYVSVGSGPGEDGDLAEVGPDPRDMVHLHVGLEKARSLLSDRLFPQAAEQLEEVLREDPDNLAALSELARAYEGANRIDAAIQAAEKALAIDTNYVRTYLTLARLENRRGARDKALELADLAIDLDPRLPEARIQKASLLIRANRAEEGQRVLEEALELHAEHPQLNSVYANLVEVPQGNLEAAEARLRTAVERDPFLHFGWLVLGQVLERRGEPDAAKEAYRSGLKRQTDSHELHGSLGLLLARSGEQESGIQHLTEAIRLAPEMHSEWHVGLGGALAESGRFAEAEREYQRVLEVHPKHPGARNNAAIALFNSGQIDAAEKMLEELVADQPRNADALNNLAAIAVERQNWEAAAFYGQKTVDLDPGSVQGWNNLGVGQQGMGRSADARASYAKAQAIDPDYWPTHHNLGLLLRDQGEFERAVREFETVLRFVPQHPDTHRELGDLFAGPLGDADRARRHYNAFLKHAPTHPRTPEVREKLAEL